MLPSVLKSLSVERGVHGGGAAGTRRRPAAPRPGSRCTCGTSATFSDYRTTRVSTPHGGFLRGSPGAAAKILAKETTHPMATIRIPTPLRKFTQGQEVVSISADTVSALITALEAQYPGLRERLLDEKGEVRRFVNIFV